MAVVVTINGVDRTSVVLYRTAKIVEAGLTQKVGGADFEVIDRTLALSFAEGQTVTFVDGAASLFDGKLSTVKRRSIHSPTGARKLIWVLTATDHNAVTDERVVGAPTGEQWVGPDTQGNYTQVDPIAHTWGSDKNTIATLFAWYVSNPALDASTFVEEFIPTFDPHGEGVIIYWDRLYLRQVLDQIAEYAGVNVFWTIRGTDVIYTRMPDPSDPDDPDAAGPMMFPAPTVAAEACPFAITDTSPNGTTTLGSMESEYEVGGGGGTTPAPEDVYVRGATDTARNVAGNPVYGGSGWYPGPNPQAQHRQQMVDARHSDTVARRDAVGARVVAQTQRGNRKGYSVVTGVNGAHAGQVIPITDAALALAAEKFIIQKVSLTFITPFVPKYRIEWGDAATRRISDGLPYQPATKDTFIASPVHAIYVPPLHPIAGADQTVEGQMVNGAGEPWRLPGWTIAWTLELTNPDGSPAVDAGATVLPATSITNAEGKASTVVTYGTITNIAYELVGKATVPV